MTDADLDELETWANEQAGSRASRLVAEVRRLRALPPPDYYERGDTLLSGAYYATLKAAERVAEAELKYEAVCTPPSYPRADQVASARVELDAAIGAYRKAKETT